MTDSLLVKRIKQLEKLAKKATKYDSIDTAYGYADETLDHVFEIVHEASIEVAEKLKVEIEDEKES